MQITTDGLVIRERSFRDDDRVITVLTREYGVLSAYAKNATKRRSRLANATELLCFSRFVLFQNKDRYIVDHADVNHLFFGIRQDMEKLALASYLCELLTRLAPKEEEAEDALRLALNTLHLLESGRRSHLFLKPLFELRLLTMVGYMPDLVACAGCGCFEGKQMYFLPRSGSLYCADCLAQAPEPGGKVPLTPSLLAAMRHILYSDFEKLFYFTLAQDTLARLGEIVEQYLLCQVEEQFDTLQFYHSLLIG